MKIEILQLLIDFGFVILIWAVQLVIYPSFKFYNPENLLKWHRLYTQKITFIVLPLMLAQLIITIVHVWQATSIFTILSLVIVVLLWLLTFMVFVPLHQSIDKALNDNTTVAKLVEKNKIRTFLWSLLFVLSAINYLLNY